MIAEILSTGDEIRSGTLVDSNSAYIALKLEETGVKVVRHHSVGDDIKIISSTLKEIAGRCDIAVVTGGLGPTSDDLTAEAAAKAAGVPLIQNPQAKKLVEAFFRNFHRPVTMSNLKQSYLPEGSACIVNPIGTAPGFMMKLGKCLFFFLPGVPAEMRRMLSESVLPETEKFIGGIRKFHKIQTLTTFGLTESATGDRLKEFPLFFPEIKLGFRAKFPEIQIKFYLMADDESTLIDRSMKATAWVAEKIGNKLVSTEGAPMEAVIGKLLSTKKATVAVAESCTGGLISNLLTNVSGSSDYFISSVVSYSNIAKVKLLGVEQEILNRYGAVHEETARSMASNVRKIAGTTYGLSTTGIAGPMGGTDEKPVGTVCIGLATPLEVRTYRFYYRFRNREMNKQIFAMTALNLLRIELLGISQDQEK